MSSIIKYLLSTTISLALCGYALAGGMATPEEAKVMSEKAIAAVNSMGKDKAFITFASADGGFQKKDLYVFCMDMQGVMLSHAKKPNLVGKNLMDFNKYGDELFKDMIKVAQNDKQGWVNYKWPYPGSEEVNEKASYIMANQKGEFFCGVGAYK